MPPRSCRRYFLLARRVFASLAFVVCLSCLLPGVAAAHARLTSADPPASSSVATPPSKLHLSFTEAVSLSFCALQLFDQHGKQIQLAPLQQAGGDATSLDAPVIGVLAAGTYGVEWRAVSAVDGHLTAGSYVFRVPAPGEAAGAPLSTVPGITPTAVDSEPGLGALGLGRLALRVIILACLSFCLGGCLFIVFAVEPAARIDAAAFSPLLSRLERRFGVYASAACALLIPCLALDLLLQVATIEQTTVGGALASPGAAGTLLSTTRYGAAWTGQIVSALLLLLALLTGSLSTRYAARTAWKVGAVAGMLFAFASALSSHPAAAQGPAVGGVPLAALSDWLHIVAGAGWVGGIFFFIFILFSALRAQPVATAGQHGILSSVVPRFSRLAIACTAAVGVTGLLNLGVQTTDIPAIVGSEYGQIVLAKAGLFVILIGLGAANLLRLSPKLAAEPLTGRPGRQATGSPSPAPQAASYLRRNIKVELVVMLVVLLGAGLLSLVPPPAGATAGSSALLGTVLSPTPTAEAEPAPLLAAVAFGNYNLVLRVEPSEMGDLLDVTVTRSSPGAGPIDDISQELLNITGIEPKNTAISIEAKLLGNQASDSQEWSAIVAPATLAGKRQISVLVERRAHPDIKAAFLLSGAPAAATTTSPSSNAALTSIPYIEVALDTDPAPPIVGNCRLTLTLSDSLGAAITPATVQVYASQPLKPGAEQSAVAMPVAGSNGVYSTTFDFSTPGGRLLNIVVTRDGATIWKSSAGLDVEQGRAP